MVSSLQVITTLIIIFPMRATFLSCYTFLHLFTLITSGEKFDLCKTSLSSFIHLCYKRMTVGLLMCSDVILTLACSGIPLKFIAHFRS